MAKDPAFLFYFRDFLVSTELMSPEDIGHYIRILCHMADKGRLTIEHMQSICKAYGTAHALHSKFKIDENGLYYNLRLEEEVLKRSNYTQSRRDNAKHMHKHMGNANGNGNKDVFKKDDRVKGKKDIGFVPPAFGDVKDYCASAGIALSETEIGRLIDFYQSKGWMVGKTKMKDWKASVRNWHRSVKDRTRFFDGKPVNQSKPIAELPTRRENPDPKMQEEVSKLISQTAKQLKERVSV